MARSWSGVIRAPAAGRRSSRRLFEIIVTANLPHSGILTTEDGKGAAVWVQTGVEDDEAVDAALVEASGEYGRRVAQLGELIGAAHPGQPHQYVFLLATGRGSSRPTCARNAALYARHGFRVTGEIALPNGPTLLAMWRDPH
jgi:hypothetical protein